MEVATPKSETKSRQTKMGWKQVSPAEIVQLSDDENDDDISLLYATPILRNTGTNAKNAISVDCYSDDRQLQRAIIASLFPQSRRRKGNNLTNTTTIVDLSLVPDPVDGDDADLQVLDESPSPSLFKIRKPFRGPSIIERGQSSNPNSETSTTFVCEICVEQRPLSQWFSIMGCAHSYCSECVTRYVASKLQDNIPQICCPVSGCSGLLEPEHCRHILPQEVFDRWGSALCEAVILAAEKFYCPYKDCSALLIDDGCGGVVITESECPYCRRLFCAQCKVVWHSGIQCAEFQKLNKDERGREDIMLMNLAKAKQWMRCPKCQFYVEKSEGCLFIRCRCRYEFCYKCGTPTATPHYCAVCKRKS